MIYRFDISSGGSRNQPPGSLSSTPALCLDSFEHPAYAHTPSPEVEECIAHLKLLKLFAQDREMIRKLAREYKIDPESAWTFYVNMAVRRFEAWSEASLRTDLRHLMPQLDVLMIWHTILQQPEAWNTLLEILSRAGCDDSFLPADINVEVSRVLGEHTVIDLMKISVSFLLTSRPDDTTEELAGYYLHKAGSVILSTPEGDCMVKFAFHEAVQDQLDFGLKVLQCSRFRVGPPNEHLDKALRIPILRYCNFLSLRLVWSGIRSVFANNHNTLLVPTLDIDLVWRTHLLSPVKYLEFCEEFHRKLIPHVPSELGESKSGHFHVTEQAYEAIFGDAYKSCCHQHCPEDRE
ncbi:hypothetical protein HJFPF1_01844 [Paramyrothecium foliicola]|nr:hypothetical protein HJFPF1_01844 [Paramyrothecium foliicola]